MVKRLSGTLAARPDPGAAQGAFYLATDGGVVYEEVGGAWILRARSLDRDEIEGRKSGALAERPDAASMVGWIYRDENGGFYEAFPDGWVDVGGSDAASENEEPFIVLDATERKSPGSYAAAVPGLTVVQSDLPGILWRLVALPVTSDASWMGFPYTTDPDGDIIVSMELADVTGTVPDRNVLGVSNGVLRLGDGLTANGRLAVSPPSSTMTLIADASNVITGFPLTSIAGNWKVGQSTLKGLSLGSTVTSTGTGSFAGCAGFTGSLVIPDSLITLGDSAFSDCTGMTGNLVLGRSLTSIGTNAFLNCNFTGPLVLPDSLISIGTTAFQNCDGFTGDLVLPPSFTTFGTGKEFQNCTGFTGALYLPSSIVGAGMVKNNTFSGCTGFTRIYVACNASAVAVGAFTPLTSTATIYYKEGTTGWGTSFDGKTTALWTSYPAPMP